MEEETVEFALDMRQPRYNSMEYGPWKKLLHEKPYFNSDILTTVRKVTPKGKEKWGDLKAYNESQIGDIKNQRDIYWIYPPSEYKRLGDITKYV